MCRVMYACLSAKLFKATYFKICLSIDAIYINKNW